MAVSDAERDEFLVRSGLKLDGTQAALEWSLASQWLCRSADGPVLVKHHRQAEAEARALAKIAEVEGARRFAPRLVAQQGDFIAHHWPSDGRSLRARQREKAGDLVEWCHRLGAALAAVHGITVDAAFRRPNWNVQELIWPVPWQLAKASYAGRQLIALVQSHDAAVTELVAMSKAQRDGTTLVHDDVRLRNVLIDDKHPLIVDWARAACGTPMADLGNVLAEIVRSYFAPESPPDVLALTVARRALVALLDGYGADGTQRLEALRWSGLGLLSREAKRADSHFQLEPRAEHIARIALSLLVDPTVFARPLLDLRRRPPVGKAPTSRRRPRARLRPRPGKAHGEHPLIRALAPIVGGLRRPVGDLSDLLYWRFFTDSQPALSNPLRYVSPFEERVTWRDGWEVVGELGGRVVVRQEGITLYAAADEISQGAGTVSVRWPCVDGAQPGFHNVISPDGAPSETPHYKLYLNLAPEGVQPFLEVLVAQPGRYTAKVFADASDFGRRDTALVYVEPERGPAMAAALCAFEGEHRELFRSPPPPLTLHLSGGVGAAESIPDMLGYGQLSCRLLARGIESALEAKAAFGDAWLPHLERAFAADGRTLEAPWRKTLSFDGFHALARARR